MTHDYPNCTFHGCDIVDTTNKILKIDQFTFKLGNVVQGLPYEDNVFDFVHMRFFIFALRKEEWPIAIKELIRVTKSGGMLQLMESIFKVSIYIYFICSSTYQGCFYRYQLVVHSLLISFQI